MDESSSHSKSKTEDTLKVKEKTVTKHTSRTYAITIKERELQGVFEAAREKGLTPHQWIKETLEKELIKSGHLPSWWLERQF